MAETIVEDGKVKCPGTIKKGGLAGKECRRALLVKDPKFGWGIPCDRSRDFHPLLSILSDLVEQGELDRKAILAAISNQKENKGEKMEKFDIDIRPALTAVEKYVRVEGWGQPKEMRFYWSNWARTIVPLGTMQDFQTQWEKVQERFKSESPRKIEYIYKKGPIIVARLVIADNLFFSLSATTRIAKEHGQVWLRNEKEMNE